MVEWKVNRSQRVCAVSGRVFEAGDNFFSALREENDSFIRLDYAEDIWLEVDKSTFFSYWKAHIPEKDQERKNRLKIDTEAFYTFFCNLQNQEKDRNRLFTYLLALILIRKRLLRLNEIEKSPEGESLIIYDTRRKEEIRIAVPEVTEEAMNEAKNQLEEIFECSTDE